MRRAAGLVACALVVLLVGRAATDRDGAHHSAASETRRAESARPIETIRVGQRVLTSPRRSMAA